LTYPDPNKKLRLYTDASEFAIGAVLVQVGEKDSEYLPGIKEEEPLYFLSHKLTKTQQRWSAIEREAYAIHYALQKLHYYLHKAKFVIRTDHKPLIEMLNAPIQNKKVEAWALNLQVYNAKLEYVRGENNNCADLLSRAIISTEEEIVTDELQEIDDKNWQVGVINTNRVTSVEDTGSETGPSQSESNQLEQDKRTIRTLQGRDPQWKRIINGLSKNPTHERMKNYLIEQGSGILLYVNPKEPRPNEKICVPGELQKRLIQSYHDENGHMGKSKVLDAITKKYYWGGVCIRTYTTG
jgi:hypothetical protein